MEEPTPVSSQMVVVKQGGKYRICIDPSDLNKILLRRHYPLRTIEDIASNIKNSKYFTKLDFLKGFWQLKVAAETQPYMTFSTPWGRYAFLRVPFGIKTAPEIFQNTISKIVENIPGVENSMDDILIHAEDIQTLRERTKIVMTTLQEAGARLNKDKCEFEKTKIKFLGHIFTSDGIKTDEEKVKAIDNIKSPSNKKELQRLLGMVQYLHKFIPNLSEITYRMRLLLKKNTEWQWDSLRDKDMERIKYLLKQAPTLKYYDPNKDVVLSVDASQHAIGAVLLQEDRPIAYASSALNDAQRHYPQIEKEALAIKFGYTIEFLKRNFSIHGIPKVLETDNGRNYASREFNEFSNKWKFNHKTSSPHYPKSNGLAERAVQIAKNILRKCKQSGDDIQIALLNYRNTPREYMGSPVQRLLSRRTKTILPISKELLRPCIQKDVTLKLRRSRNKQKFYYDKGSRDEPTFKIGQEVYLRENRRNWKPATIVREDGPRSYTVQNNKGLYRRNQSHITTNQSQRDHESILEQEPSGSACSTMEQDQETQPKGSDRMELQSETDNPAGEEETREVRKFTRSGRQEQLEEMTRLGVIESVEEPTEWCAGMVAVSKPGGKIRICVDLTKLNQYIRRENYPLPATEHILGQLGNTCYFSKLDANSGFWQFGLAKESQKLTTFITPFGRFFFKRIPFGKTSAPEIFQRKMTQLLGKIEGVVCFMDDIVVYGSSLEEHNERVRQVLKKIQEEGMTLNPEKCQFGVKTVKFLGHTLSSEGLFIDEEKLDAITKMEAPRSTKELKSFLGMVNYLGKFIPNLADKLQPLNSLLSTKNEYPEISLLQNLTAQEVISRLKSIFARHGTPETVRSDNGPQFQKVLGSEFSKFSKEWSFKHITSSPKFPQSNGFIEAIIKNIKQSFKKEEDCYLTLQAYRTMPLESGYSPAELLMGRRLRTSVPAIESSLMPRYLDSEALQEREKRRVINQKRLYDKRHDVHSLPPLQQGDCVWIRDQRVEGTVLHKSEEPRSYWVQTPQGKVRRNKLHLTPLPKMGSTMDASEDGQRQEQRNEETPTSTSTWLSRRCKDDQEQETEEDCPTPTASSTRDGRMQRDNQDQDPEKSLPSMPAVHTRYGRAVKIPRRYVISNCYQDKPAWISQDVLAFPCGGTLIQTLRLPKNLPSLKLLQVPISRIWSGLPRIEALATTDAGPNATLSVFSLTTLDLPLVARLA
ncbi:K02A2.6-like, partial [Cordylochernes scorpioides]